MPLFIRGGPATKPVCRYWTIQPPAEKIAKSSLRLSGILNARSTTCRHRTTQPFAAIATDAVRDTTETKHTCPNLISPSMSIFVPRAFSARAVRPSGAPKKALTSRKGGITIRTARRRLGPALRVTSDSRQHQNARQSKTTFDDGAVFSNSANSPAIFASWLMPLTTYARGTIDLVHPGARCAICWPLSIRHANSFIWFPRG